MIIPSQLAYLPIQNDPALKDWLAEHSRWHKKTAEAAMSNGNAQIGQYSFADMADRDDWLYFHNADHISISEAFNTSTPPDLSYWDQNDKTNFDNWLMAHALVHDDIRKALDL